jgi:hypothetical protein
VGRGRMIIDHRVKSFGICREANRRAAMLPIHALTASTMRQVPQQIFPRQPF